MLQFSAKKLFRKNLAIPATVTDATICSKPGDFPLIYPAVRCKVVFCVSGNARNPNYKLSLTSIIEYVLTLPFPSSHVPPVSGCFSSISAKIDYNKGNIIGN